MACNNHIFFNCLSPTQTEPTPTFITDIEDSFSSYDTLRIELIETADAMFGPGFVWIVKDQDSGKMKLLCTYLAGSPFPLAHFRAQQNDMATFNTSIQNAGRYMSSREPNNPTGSFGPYSRFDQFNPRSPSGYRSYPILCVNTWEHAYLRDYGIGGKRMYLERWWDRVDWAVVETNAKVYGPEAKPVLGRRLNSVVGKSFQQYQSRM
jgi:superoxide dismutase, Fe-Mn family